MMRRTAWIASAATLLTLAACDQAGTDATGMMTGTWHYRATSLVEHNINPSISCDVEYDLDLTQKGEQLEGLTRRGSEHIVCVQPGHEPTELRDDTYGYVAGEVRDGRVHFSIIGNYHSFGELNPDHIEGHVEGYSSTNPDGPFQVDTLGTFTLDRVR
jgi:hypothetical protein